MAITIQRASRLANIPSDRLFKRWVSAALNRDATITLRIVNSKEARQLNRDFRGKDYATNVLTFVYHLPHAKKLEGDIVLCAQVVAREAREQRKTIQDHYAHLTIHGVLHLTGLDHETSQEAKVMERREGKILATFGLQDPYKLLTHE